MYTHIFFSSLLLQIHHKSHYIIQSIPKLFLGNINYYTTFRILKLGKISNKISSRHLFSYYTFKIIQYPINFKFKTFKIISKFSTQNLFFCVSFVPNYWDTRSVRDCFVCDSTPSIWNGINGYQWLWHYCCRLLLSTSIPSWLSITMSTSLSLFYFIHYSHRFIHRSSSSRHAALITAAQ